MSYEQEWLALADVLEIEGHTSPAKMVEQVRAARAHWDAERARLLAAIKWVESYYWRVIAPEGCPCDDDKKCPLHAALAGSPEGTPETPRLYRGHIDPDCEVVRQVGHVCTCSTDAEKAEDAKWKAECEAERDAAEAPARAEAQPSPLIRASQKVVDFLRACEWNDRTSETDATDLAEELEQAIIARADEGRP